MKIYSTNQRIFEMKPDTNTIKMSVNGPIEGVLLIHLSGEWRIGDPLPSLNEIKKQLASEMTIHKIAFDARNLTQWAIIDASGKSILLTKKSQYTESVTETTYTALVDAHSRLIAAFSNDIAKAFKSLF